MLKKLSVLLVVLVVLVVLTACGGGDKNKVVSEGDIATCLALNGPDISAWKFSPLEQMSNNVCYVYQVQTTR